MNKHFRSISKTKEQNEKDSEHLPLIDVLRGFQNHPSIRKIKSSFSDNTTLNITPVPREALRHIITNLDHKKATGHDMVNAKFFKISVNIILQPLLNILNKCILQGTFPKSLKKAVVTPVYKKKDPFNKENYRPISLLTTFSKVFEKAIELQLSPFFEKKFSKYLCAYRKHFSSQHALFRLIEDWKSGLEKNKHIGAVLMDLSKAFDCLPKNLLLAKLHAYGVEQGSLLLIQNYLSDREQKVKVKGRYSSWGNLGQGVPQGSILGPLLFNTFINDIFYNLSEGSLCNFADDNTISITANSTDELLNLIKSNTKNCIKWFKENEMTANPSKFQAITIGSKDKNIDDFEIDTNFSIKVDNIVTLLGVELDKNLKFDSHIDKICKKAAKQLNSLKRIAKYMGDKEKKIIINSFILCHFNYCPLIWMLCSKSCQDKLEKINERALRLAYSDYTSSYEALLTKCNETTIHVQSIRLLGLEIYKTLNNLNPIFMRDYFLPKRVDHDLRRTNPLQIPKARTTAYGINSLCFQGPKIWNVLPAELKSATNVKQFKNLTKNWFLNNRCACSYCNK
ncbi:MAG: reverse transcriptase family protein [Desulfobacterales bacterium]|nr:reverse transcriptase family protein [Desulfobacterales bacterium]